MPSLKKAKRPRSIQPQSPLDKLLLDAVNFNARVVSIPAKSGKSPTVITYAITGVLIGPGAADTICDAMAIYAAGQRKGGAQ